MSVSCIYTIVYKRWRDLLVLLINMISRERYSKNYNFYTTGLGSFSGNFDPEVVSQFVANFRRLLSDCFLLVTQLTQLVPHNLRLTILHFRSLLMYPTRGRERERRKERDVEGGKEWERKCNLALSELKGKVSHFPARF